jgi:hypothetical protein
MNFRTLINFINLPLILFILLSHIGFGQEVLSGLQFNPVVRQKAMEMAIFSKSSTANDTLPVLLPFRDDFSTSYVFPSSERWSDLYAFVNTDFPVNPVNLGVVTLDAINDSGSMYPEAVPGPEPFIADHLTSRYIRLDSLFSPVPKALTPADSVYLSFYYQPQGRGYAPKTLDSLVLQFLVPAFDSITPTDTIHFPATWKNVWATKGISLDTFYLQYNRYFKQVLIPVTKQRYFNKYFRFRFYNYVSLASSGEPSWQSNCGEWNIDNTYLNIGRSMNDTVYKELRFIERPPSMLKNYQSMPYPQYSDDPTEEMIDTIAVTMRNRDTVAHLISYKYTVSYPNGTIIKTYTPGKDTTIRPYPKYNELTLRPPVTFLYPIASSDSAEFVLKHFIKDKSGSGMADTITGNQKLYNYYAYDDGTPEKGYGVTRTGSKIAYRFRLNKSPDTLRAVSIFFNKTLSNANQQFFYLTVWNDNNGKPGDTIYSRIAFVRFTDVLNKFVTYHLEVPVRISGTFYIGMITTTDDNLNIGFDRYNNAQENLLYNSAGQWNTSAFSGSLLMRPLIGKPIPLGIPGKRSPSSHLSVFPNPCAASSVRISCSEPELDPAQPGSFMLRVRNMMGQDVLLRPYEPVVDVSRLISGLYIVEVKNPATGKLFTGKLLIIR